MVISKFKARYCLFQTSFEYEYFSDVDEVIERANRTEFGLAGGVFSVSKPGVFRIAIPIFQKDTNLALRVARRIKAGTIFVNNYQKTDVAAPFGGFKQSGFGKDLGQEALNEYLQTKTITMEF